MTSSEDNKKERVKDEDRSESGKGSRARNRTVMLTPDITGEVRARLAEDMMRSEGFQEASEEDAFHSPITAHSVEESSSDSFRPITPARDENPAREELKSAQPKFQHHREVLTDRKAVKPQTVSPNISEGALGVRQDEMPLATRPPVASQSAAYRIRQGIIWSKLSPIMGFLVAYDADDNGEFFELRQGRLIITSEPPATGNFLVLDDESVSPMHAIVRLADFGELQILDQLSELGTRIVRGDSGEEEVLSGEKGTVYHGDTLIFGKKKFSVCLIAGRKSE
jgi:hypothetical protein